MLAERFIRHFALISAASALCLLASCRGSAPEEITPLPEKEIWQFEAHREGLIEQSCPEGRSDGFALSFLAGTEPVSLASNEAELDEALSGLVFEAGWALSAAPASFGGLSGLEILPSGDLLAVSDGGALAEIGFDQKNLRPTGQVKLSFLQDTAGEILTGKSAADAEGLAYSDGVALVSFERDHRILAYAYGVCGSNARGIPVSDIGSSPQSLGGTIRSNGGAEALMLEDGQLVTGLEGVVDRLGPIGVIGNDGVPEFAARPWLAAEGLPLVGFDSFEGQGYSLHRAWNPVTGNSIMVTRFDKDGTTVPLARLSRPLTVDNFEGIAGARGPDDAARLFIISDDNFSGRQRTLLFVFRLED